jgi:hypothetical protein
MHSSKGSHEGILCRDLGSVWLGRYIQNSSRGQKVLRSSFARSSPVLLLVPPMDSSKPVFVFFGSDDAVNFLAKAFPHVFQTR